MQSKFETKSEALIIAQIKGFHIIKFKLEIHIENLKLFNFQHRT